MEKIFNNPYLRDQIESLFADLNQNRLITDSVTNQLCTLVDAEGNRIEVHLTLQTDENEMVHSDDRGVYNLGRDGHFIIH